VDATGWFHFTLSVDPGNGGIVSAQIMTDWWGLASAVVNCFLCA
jgi:hypothetical protein